MALNGQPTVFVDSVSDVTATLPAGYEVGIRRYKGNEQYMLVYNNGNSQATVGNGVTITALTGYSVTVSSVTSVNPCFGVVRNATMTTATYGWVVIKGFSSLKADASTGLAVGDACCLGTDGVFQRLTGATGYAFAPVCAWVLQATASAGLGYGYVNAFQS